MAGVSDYAFRCICREMGAEWTVSEMISAKALCFEQLCRRESGAVSRSAPLARIKPEEHPMSLQIFGNDPKYMAEATRLLLSCEYKHCESRERPDAIDINMGCPVHKVVANGEGSALMRTPETAEQIVKCVVAAAGNVPVTVKLRAGWDGAHINAVELAKRCEGAGASAIFVHARTREEMYHPGIRPEVIADVKRSVKIPVIGNGDIYSGADAQKMIQDTGCDGVMIGRGATGNPWIFADIRRVLQGEKQDKNCTLDLRPSFGEVVKTIKKQVNIMIEDKGERIASTDCKKHVAWYIKDIRGGAALRDRVMGTSSTSELFELLDEAVSVLENFE